MSTKKETTQTNAYAPAGMATYNQTQPQVGNTYSQFMQDPRTAPWVQGQRALAARQAQQFNARGMSNMTQNMAAGGFGGGSPAFMQAMIARQSRAGSAIQASGDQNALLNGYQMQMDAANNASGYRPLQTGGTQVEKTSGLGTWLPQVIGAGVGIASGIASGGATKLSKLGGALGGAAGAFGGGAPQMSSNPFLNMSGFDNNVAGGGLNYGASRPARPMGAYGRQIY